MSIKIERLNHLYQEEISKILMFEVKDSLIKFVTVTGVDTTNDLSFMKVYVTTFDTNKETEVIKALNNAKGFVRSLLSQRVDSRHTPEIKFILDESIEYGMKIEKIINEIKND